MSDFSDDDNDDVDNNNGLSATILGLQQNRPDLNKALNGHYRGIINKLASENNPVPDNFCVGASEPSLTEIEYMKHTFYGDLNDEASRIAAADSNISESSKGKCETIKYCCCRDIIFILIIIYGTTTIFCCWPCF